MLEAVSRPLVGLLRGLSLATFRLSERSASHSDEQSRPRRYCGARSMTVRRSPHALTCALRYIADDERTCYNPAPSRHLPAKAVFAFGIVSCRMHTFALTIWRTCAYS
jgi:hypothetical protein